MNNVFAKVKGDRKKPFVKVLSNHTLFNLVNVDVDFCVDYVPDHNLDEDAWFKVEEFSKKVFCIDLLRCDFDSKEYEDLKKDQFQKISYIFAVQSDDFYFQKVSPSVFLSKKIIAFGEIAKIEESAGRLVVNSVPDAVYLKAKDALIFRSLATVSSIFKGIDDLYREATNEDVGKFLDSSFIELDAGYGIQSVSKPNRKRIALAMETLNSMSDLDRENMLTYINGYCKDKMNLDPATSKFKVTKDDELKLLLYGVEQRFYTTPFGNEKRIANSVMAIK
jgi:hypothetical protein